MEKLTREEVLHVAHLARIKVDEEEIEKYQVELKQLLNDVDKIKEVKGFDDERMIAPWPKDTTTREDIPGEMLNPKEVLKNAPKHSGNYIEVPIVISESEGPSMKYLDKTIEEIHNALKTKEIKPIDLVEEAFERIEKNKDLNAYITLNKEEALKKAKSLEEKEVGDNLLFGLPIAVKDNIVTKGLKTTCASHILDNFIPIYNATVVEKLEQNDMIIIGKKVEKK